MDKLLRMLDDLDEKLFADQHVDDDYPGLLAEDPVKFSKDAEEQSQDSKSQQRSDLQSKVGKKAAVTNSTKVEREQDDDDFTFFLPNKKLSELINVSAQGLPPFRSVIESFLPLHDCLEDSPTAFSTVGSGCAICGNTNIDNVRTARTARDLAETGFKERILAAESALRKRKFDKPAEGEEELLAESAEGDLFEEDAEMAGQKEKESQVEEEETVVIKSDGVDLESRDLPLGPPASNPRSRNTNRESVSTEQSLMFNDADKSKRSSFPLSSTGDFESPLERQQTPFSFTPIRVVPDSTYHFASASRLRQKDAATSPTPGQSENKKAAISSPSVSQPRQVQDRNITLPGLSIPPIKEKEDTKVDKPKMIPRDVSDEPNPNKGVTGGKGKNMHITEILRSDPHEEALKSRPPSPTKVRHSVSVKSSRPRTTSTSHSASAPQQAEDVSAQAEDSRSSSTSVLDADQVELPHPSSAPLPENSKNVEPSRQDPQAEKETHRSSARGVFKRSVNSLKNLKNSTIGKVVTHNRRRRPTAESSLKAVLKTDNKKRAAARRDKENKKQKSSQKKLTGDLASNSSRSGRSGQRPSMRCSMSCSLSCSM
ncbi:hypothetical protein KCU73_g3706, partial [Aureobasidium melanogenum]